MLSFSFKSLTFQPPLRSRKRLHLQIELDEGPNHRTECFTYTPYKSVSIDEPLELLVLEPESVTSFELSIYEHGEKGHHDHKIIAEETIDIAKVLNKTFTEITLPTIYGTDAVIDMNLEISKEILDTTSEENIKTENLDYLDSILTGDIFRLSKLIPILHQAVLAMSPLILLKDAIISFLTWEDQMVTLGGSVGFTIFMLFGRYLTALGLLIFSLFGKKMIPYITKMKPVQKTKPSKLTIYKNNARFFKDVIRIFLYVVDYYKNIFESHDKTIAVQLLLRLKQISFFAAIFLFLFPLNYGIICLYWLVILYNTPFGKKSLLYSYSTLFKFLDKIDLKTIYPLKIQKEKSVRKASSTLSPAKKADHIETYSTGPSLNDLSSHSPESNKVRQITKEKVFVVYENQRWWPGKGWRPELLPGERPSWSDDLGLVVLMKEDVGLPTGNWEWESDWKYVVTSKTDEEGWEYASRFKRFEQPDRKRRLLRAVRRRKWTRRCICFDE